MNWKEEDWPKFIMGDDPAGKVYVTHLHHPRFVGKVEEDDTGATITPHWIDEPELDAPAIAKLMREAGDFLTEEIHAHHLNHE